MRYAILSDIHSNWQAWNAVLVDARSCGVDRFVCLGDIVGYGPQPARVLESVHENVHHVILGNHDAAVCGKLDENLFNDAAADIVRWTRGRLNRSAMAFLNELPLTLKGEAFRCAHGDVASPAQYNYVIDPEDAMPSWAATDDQLMFVGHSHDPAIFLLGRSGRPHRVAPQDFILEDEKRYIVNVGSVGQPRDGDARAAYCIFDTGEREVLWRRIPFDLDAYRADLAEAGVDEAASYFLRADPRQGARPIRETLSFSPPASAKDGARDVVEVAELEELHRSVKRWKRTVACVAAIAVIGLSGGGYAFHQHATRRVVITPPALSNLTIAPHRANRDANILATPAMPVATPNPLPGWHVHLGHRRKQAVRWETAPDPQFVIDSAWARGGVRIESPDIQVAKGQRYRLTGLIRMSAEAVGSLKIDVTLWKQNANGRMRVDHFAGDLADSPRKNGWNFATETFSIPAEGVAMRVGVDGVFAGRAEIRDLQLFRLE
jgi:predicted phosphodiesterase